MLNEDQVVAPLLDTYTWVLAKRNNRDNADFYIKTSNNLFPVNIKLLSNLNCITNQSNNLCGMVSVVSTLLYGRSTASKVNLAKMMSSEEFTRTPQAYGLLVVNKSTGFTLSSNLFELTNIHINPTNGLQFKYSYLETVDRTQLEGQQFIFDKVVELFRVQAKPYELLSNV